MSTTLLGADADELERIAGTLRSAADELDAHAGSVTATLRSVAWVGGVATRFGSNWNGAHRPRITSTAQYVRDAAAQLDRNAAEQRRASHSGSGGPPGGSAAPTPGSGPSPSVGDEPGSPVLDRLGDLLTGLGVGHDVLELLAEHTALLDGLGVDKLIDILTNDDFVSLLKGLDQVLEVGEVVVNLVADFVENPGLPFDERVVHGLSDAATRFGIAEDAVTGSAHCALGPYWGARLGRTRLLAYQVSARGGAVRVDIGGSRVRLGGRAVTVLRGALLSVPPTPAG